MPLIGLVRLRWALGGATPPFDPIARPDRLQSDDQLTTGNRVLRSWATMKRHQAGNGLVTWLHVKVGQVPPVGRIERAQRLPHRKAFERTATYEGIKAKAGDTGTWRNPGSMDSSTL
jgi:hypothetical protein